MFALDREGNSIGSTALLQVEFLGDGVARSLGGDDLGTLVDPHVRPNCRG